jgi:hypothetical protein
MLLETDRRVRDVGFLQCRDLLGGQFHINGSDRIVELMQLGGANDRCGDDRLRQEPGKRNLCTGDASDLGHLGDAVGDFPVGFFGLGEEPAERPVGLGADAGVFPVAAELAACLRAPGDDADAFGRADFR